MPKFECRIRGRHEKYQWFPMGDHPRALHAAGQMLCQAAGPGGQDLTLDEIECRQVRSVNAPRPMESSALRGATQEAAENLQTLAKMTREEQSDFKTIQEGSGNV